VDFDGDLERARQEADAIVGKLNVLYSVPANYMRLAFSGSKGFHIVIPIEAFTNNPRMELDFFRVFLGVAHDLLDGFEGVDFKIYESKRIFRMSNTINAKTGLYKIPITLAELRDLSIEQIQELAKSPRRIDFLPTDEISPVEQLSEIYEKHRRSKKEPQKAEGAGLIAGKLSGGRNDALTKLTGLYISTGFDEEFTLEFMRLWNEKNAPPLDDDELKETISKQFRLYGRKKEIVIHNLREAGARYRDYVKRLQYARVNIGFGEIDAMTRGIAPGEVMNILGKTSVGKSALIQNIARNYAQSSGEPTVFFSMEMPETLVFERNYQMEVGQTGYEVEKAFSIGHDDDIEKHIETAFEATPSLYLVDQSGLTLDDITRYIQHGENETYKRKTGLILIDYLGLISHPGQIYEAMSKVARGIKNLAKDNDVPIVSLVQISSAKQPTDKVELSDARDSGAIEEASDYLLGVWRDEMQTDSARVRLKIGLLKNRKGALGGWPMTMERSSLIMTIARDYDTVHEPNF
jgi:hypothetical protein